MKESPGRFEFYTYTCAKHALGEHVRELSEAELAALQVLAQTVAHATNCWVKGCQMPSTQARRIRGVASETTSKEVQA